MRIAPRGKHRYTSEKQRRVNILNICLYLSGVPDLMLCNRPNIGINHNHVYRTQHLYKLESYFRMFLTCLLCPIFRYMLMRLLNHLCSSTLPNMRIPLTTFCLGYISRFLVFYTANSLDKCGLHLCPFFFFICPIFRYTLADFVYCTPTQEFDTI